MTMTAIMREVEREGFASVALRDGSEIFIVRLGVLTFEPAAFSRIMPDGTEFDLSRRDAIELIVSMEKEK